MKDLFSSRRTKKVLAISFFGTLALLTSACSEEPVAKPPKSVVAIKVADISALAQAPFPGRAKATQEVNLSFRVSGPLIDLPVKVGDKVKTGDVVARLDPKDYVNAVGTARGQLNRAKASAERAEADYKRIIRVFKQDPGATSESAIDLAKATRDSSRATVNSLKSALTSTEDQLNYTSLHAPFDGVVVATYSDNFETIIAKQPVLRLLDPSTIEFVIYVPETLISYVSYVQGIEVTFDALPGVKIPAKIQEVGREASQATRTYPVTLSMEQPKGAEILAGMAGSAVVTAKLPEDAQTTGIEIPATAVFSKEDPLKSYIWIIEETSKTLSSREVSVGRLTSTGVIIQSGLKSGEWVVIKGVNSVRDGQEVRVIDFKGKDASA